MHCKFGRNINNNYNISENATCILGLSSSSSFKQRDHSFARHTSNFSHNVVSSRQVTLSTKSTLINFLFQLCLDCTWTMRSVTHRAIEKGRRRFTENRSWRRTGSCCLLENARDALRGTIAVVTARESRTSKWSSMRILTSRGFFKTIQPDSGWISKYSSPWSLFGELNEYVIAPLLSASSSDADTLRMFVPILASCFTFSTYRCKQRRQRHWSNWDQTKKGNLVFEWRCFEVKWFFVL